MLNVALIGIGNCGNQIAALAKKDAGIDVICINTSENDLATLPAELKEVSFLVGDSEGSGKNRAGAKKFLKEHITKLVSDEKFKDIIMSKDVIFIASSTGGGTGSGMAPIMSSIIRQAFRNDDGSEKPVILIGVLPRLSEGLSTQVNSMDYLRELFDVLENPTYMLYDNNNFSKESSYVVLQKVNQEIVTDIKILQCLYNLPTPFDSIDERDMKTILYTPGLISIAGIFGIKEKDLDEETLEDLIIDKMKSNAHTELQRDGIVSRTGLITNLSEKLNATFDTHLNKVRDFIGEPVEEFLHIAVNTDRDMPNNIAFVATGLSKPVDRMDKIRDRIDEINKKQEEQERNKRDGVIDADEIDALNAKRNYRSTSTANQQVDLKNTFEKFGC